MRLDDKRPKALRALFAGITFGLVEVLVLHGSQKTQAWHVKVLVLPFTRGEWESRFTDTHGEYIITHT